MIRTFHSKLNRKTLVFYLLSATVLTAYFFWVKLPLPALCCMVFLVFVVERLIHTSYVFADDGCLYIRQGRFSKVKKLVLLEIRETRVVYPSALTFLKNSDAVMLEMQDGSLRFIIPSPAEEFCKYLKRRRRNVLKRSERRLVGLHVRWIGIFIGCLAGWLWNVPACLSGESVKIWHSSLDSLLQDELLQTSQLGLCVYDLTSDSLMYAFQARQRMRPVSTEKIVTAVTALSELGGNYHFRTRLYHTGELRDGILWGDLYIIGGFDPCFGQDDLKSFVDALVETDVDSIAGRLCADVSMKNTLQWDGAGMMRCRC